VFCLIRHKSFWTDFVQFRMAQSQDVWRLLDGTAAVNLQQPDRNVVLSSRLSLASNIQILIKANYPLTLNSAAYSKEGIPFPITAELGVSRRHMQSFVRLAMHSENTFSKRLKAPKSARITRVKTNTRAATLQRVTLLDSALLVAENVPKESVSCSTAGWKRSVRLTSYRLQCFIY